MSTAAFFMAVGGVGWAATELPPASIDEVHLRDGAVSSAKIRYRAVTGDKLGADALQGVLPQWRNVNGHLVGPGAYLSKASLSSANLSGLTLGPANLSGASLGNANLFQASLRGADLTEASLRGANLSSVVADSASFRYARMAGARLDRGRFAVARLDHADLTNASLVGVDFGGANLSYVKFAGATVGATGAPVDLTGATLTGAQLRSARFVSVVGTRIVGRPLDLPAGWRLAGGTLSRVP